MENNYDQIEAYLDGTLPPEERAAFESRLQEDEALRRELEAYKQARAAIRDAARRDLRATVDKAYKEQETKAGQLRSIRRRLAIAAAVLFLIGAVFVIRYFVSPAGPQQLYAEYFEPPPTPAQRSGETADAWNAVVEDYQRRNYEEVARDLQNLLSDPDFERPAQGYLYLGVSRLVLGQTAAAADSFRRIPETSSLNQERAWYLALTYLRAEDTARAEAQLREIAAQTGHYKQEEAQRLLEQL